MRFYISTAGSLHQGWWGSSRGDKPTCWHVEVELEYLWQLRASELTVEMSASPAGGPSAPGRTIAHRDGWGNIWQIKHSSLHTPSGLEATIVELCVSCTINTHICLLLLLLFGHFPGRFWGDQGVMAIEWNKVEHTIAIAKISPQKWSHNYKRVNIHQVGEGGGVWFYSHLSSSCQYGMLALNRSWQVRSCQGNVEIFI